MTDLRAYLSGNPYPGRGILLGRSPDNRRAVIAYFIMGRSENSRNRVFISTEDGIRTQAFDPAKMSDPSLIIYHPVRKVDGITVVTNGDQTDTIAEALRRGENWTQALRTREFEPDAPNYTPRVSGIVRPDGSYRLSILKSAGGNPACCQRFFFEYASPIPGEAHLIHTYDGDGNPLPSFTGEPRSIILETGDCGDLSELLWGSLNAENKVSLFVQIIDLSTGTTATLLRNKHN